MTRQVITPRFVLRPQRRTTTRCDTVPTMTLRRDASPASPGRRPAIAGSSTPPSALLSRRVTIAEPGPQRLKKSLFFFGQTRYLDHGWPLGKQMEKSWLPLSTPKQASPQAPGGTDRNYTALKIHNKLLLKSYQPVNFELFML